MIYLWLFKFLVYVQVVYHLYILLLVIIKNNQFWCISRTQKLVIFIMTLLLLIKNYGQITLYLNETQILTTIILVEAVLVLKYHILQVDKHLSQTYFQ